MVGDGQLTSHKHFSTMPSETTSPSSSPCALHPVGLNASLNCPNTHGIVLKVPAAMVLSQRLAPQETARDVKWDIC